MASVEQRGTHNPHWRVVWREAGIRESEKFPTPEQAEIYCQQVTRNGNRRALTTTDVTLAGSQATITPQSWTFADWARFWIATLSGPREMTLARYRSVIERDLIPVFGHLDIAAITTPEPRFLTPAEFARLEEAMAATPAVSTHLLSRIGRGVRHQDRARMEMWQQAASATSRGSQSGILSWTCIQCTKSADGTFLNTGFLRKNSTP